MDCVVSLVDSYVCVCVDDGVPETINFTFTSRPVALSVSHAPTVSLVGNSSGSEDGSQPGKIPPTIVSGGGSSGSGGFAASLNGVSMILGGDEASRWGNAGGGGAGDPSETPRLKYLRAKSAATR